MVQPQPEGTLHFDMMGEDSGGALRVPPELASNEVVTRLLGDNQQLREALRNSNMALRQRCEEMEGWQRRTKEEREFLSSRFQEARALVERLAQENHSLQGQVMNGPSLGAGGSGTTNLNSARGIGDTQDQEAPGRPERNGLLEGSQTLDPSAVVRKRTEETDPHNQMPARSLGDASVNSSINSSLSTPPTSLNEARGNGRGTENRQPAEGANEFLQLLKSHKEKLEEGMRELRSRNEELEKEREESEREKDGLRRAIEQFRVQLAQTQASGEEPTQRSEAQHSSDRYRELQEKLDSLQKISAQRDRSEALLKQKDKDCAQLAKDCEALKAQATSLLGELKERQSCLDKSEHDRKGLEDKLCSKMEALQAAERELEQQRKQQHVTVDKLRLQTQNLETALKTERHVITEERKKLTQLQHAYTCLFRDYDSKLKNETQGGDLCSRLEEAERALVMKQDLIDKLKEEVEQQRGSLETVPVLTAQAEIYKADFLAEREAREKLHQRKEELQDQLSQALAEIDRLKKEGTSRARIEEMQQRHMEDFRSPRQPLIPPQQGVFPGAAFNTAPPPSSFRSVALVPGGASAVAGTEELPDFRCPKCQYQAPDMDTLQIHVMDCIQ